MRIGIGSPNLMNVLLAGNCTRAASLAHTRSSHFDRANGSNAMPFLCSINLCTHGVVSLYGGFIHTLPCQGLTRPLSSCV